MNNHYHTLSFAKPLTLSLLLTCMHSTSLAAELSGYAGVQTRNFLEDPLSPAQENNYLSAVIEPELYAESEDRSENVEIKLFYRKDQHDEQRTHADVREFSYTRVFDSWEMRVGISKVFWGVAETQHLVDIVNQTDLVENVDGEDKLGQPMLRASTEQDWGIIDLFILPGFRERTFPGEHGRPRPEVVVDTGLDAVYDSSDGDRHVDWAARYSHYIGEWEFGLSVFDGTGREPTDFIPVNITSSGEPVVVPVYSLITQYGLDGQAFFGDWTWKLEAINTHVNSGTKKGIDNFQSVFGFEYTWVGFADTSMDLGFVVEYHYSEENIITTIFDNDLATALRFVVNDAQSTEVLAGVTTDADTQTYALFVEASRRLGDSWTIEAQVRGFHGTTENRPLYSFRFDDFAQIDLNYYF